MSTTTESFKLCTAAWKPTVPAPEDLAKNCATRTVCYIVICHECFTSFRSTYMICSLPTEIYTAIRTQRKASEPFLPAYQRGHLVSRVGVYDDVAFQIISGESTLHGVWCTYQTLYEIIPVADALMIHDSKCAMPPYTSPKGRSRSLHVSCVVLSSAKT